MKAIKNAAKRSLAMLLVLVLCLSMVNLTAFAATAGEAKDQIGKYLGYDDNGKAAATPNLDANSITKEIRAGDDKITITKEITNGDQENLFNINLVVTTTEHIKEIELAPDAAVVLVIDTSGSMNRNKIGSQTRMEVAKDVATTFVEDYAATADGVVGTSSDKPERWLSLVHFDTNAKTVRGWTDVVANGTDSITGGISSLSADNGGTFMQGGLRLAYNLLQMSQVKGIENKFVILLTDGLPTYQNLKHEESNGWNSTTEIKNDDGTGAVNNPREQEPVDYVANDIKKIASLYTVALGKFDTETDGKVKTMYTRDKSYPYNTPKDFRDWLPTVASPDCSIVVEDNKLELQDAFRGISRKISTLLDVWTVKDPMGAHIEFLGGVTNGLDGAGDPLDEDGEWSFAGNALTWDLLKADHETSGSGNTKTYTYTLSYKVRLKTEDGSFKDLDDKQQAVYNATNGQTYLTYVPTERTNDKPTRTGSAQTAYFNVPSVHGYLGTLEFTKVGPDGNTPLNGATFELTHDASECKYCQMANNKATGQAKTNGAGKAVIAPKTAISGDETVGVDGRVTFTNIPSGHSYTLKETKAPTSDNYALSTETYTVDVAYGTATLKDGNKIVEKITNYFEEKYEEIKVTKQWFAPEGTELPEITIKLVCEQDDNLSKTATLKKSGTTWEHTFEKVLVKDRDGNTYSYHVEELEVSGYTPKVEDYTITNTITGTIDITVEKQWVSNVIPTGAEVTVTVKNGDKVVDEVTLSDKNGWSHTFKDLPKYDNGTLINYSVEEDDNSAYQQVKKDFSESGNTYTYTFVNTVTDQVTEVKGQKTWIDGNNVNGTRPDSITVILKQNGEYYGEVKVEPDANGNWEYSFTELPVYTFLGEAGEVTTDVSKIARVFENTYTVEEKVDEETGKLTGTEYKPNVTGNNITNTLTGTTELTVTKEWVILPEGIVDTPDSVEVELLVNGLPASRFLKILGDVKTKMTLSAENNWTGKFEDLPKYDIMFGEYSYSVREVGVPDGFVDSYEKTDDGVTVTNTYIGETFIAIHKTWAQPADAAEQAATFRVLANGEEYQTVTITGNGSYFISNLPLYKEVTKTTTTEVDGEEVEETTTEYVEIEYTVEEVNIPGYKLTESTQEGNSWYFTNTITGNTTVTVEKTWIHPEGTNVPDVTFDIYANGVKTNKTITLTNDAKKGSVTLPKYDDNGQVIIYKVVEQEVDGYSSMIKGGRNDDGTFTFTATNTINQATKSVTVSKIWRDDGNVDGKRPANVTLILKQNGEPYATIRIVGGYLVTDENGEPIAAAQRSDDGNTWSYTFENLPVYDKNRTTEYTYTVDEADVTGYNKEPNGLTVTNTIIGNRDIEITKYWKVPSDMVDELPEITLTLTGSDDSEYTVKVNAASAEVTGGDGVYAEVNANGKTWSITVKDLPAYTSDGDKIYYELSEDDVPGFNKAVSDENGMFTVTNTIEQARDVALSVEKTFGNMDQDEDDYNNTPVRPDSVTVALFRNGVKMADTEDVMYTVTLSDENEWTAEFTGLDRYNLTTGEEYTYEIFELDASGAKLEAGDRVIFEGGSTYEVGYEIVDGVTTITNNYVVPANYYWMVVANYRHYDYRGNLIEDHLNVPVVDVTQETEQITVTAQLARLAAEKTVDPSDYAECEGLTYNFDAEHEDSVLTVKLEKQNHLYVLVLNYELREARPVTTGSLTISKVVEGVGDEANGKLYSFTVTGANYTKTVEVAAGARVTLSGLTPGAYTVTENTAGADIAGYTLVDVTGEGTVNITANRNQAITITNTYTQDLTTEITVNKEWAGDNAEVRPESILVQLTRDDEAYGEPVLLNEENGWTHTWTDLETGHEWSVLEVNVPAGYEATYSVSEDGTVWTITNAYTTEVTVIKEWDDEDDADGIRPDSVTVQLYRGMFPHGDPVTLDESNDWSHTWTDLPLGYDYRVVEVGVAEGYDASYEQDGDVWTITNTHIPDEEFEIIEDDVPLAPGIPQGPDEMFEIPEDDVPLASVPKTGDDSRIWGFFAMISGIGLALMALFRKKQDDSAE